MKKFELAKESIETFGRKLFRIKALAAFGDVEAGTIGGYVEREENLSQSGDAWVSGDAQVYGNARVSGDAWVYGNARVYSDAQVYGNAWVYGNARVYGDAWVSGDACVSGDAWVSCDADYICFKGFGSVNRNTTMFKTKNGSIAVSCGCFSGTLEEFEDKVKETHSDSKYAKEYLACVEATKIHFEV